MRKTGSADEARVAVRRPSIVSLVLRVVVGVEMWCAVVLGALARVSLDVREVDGFGFGRGGVPEDSDDQPATPGQGCCDGSFAGSGDASPVSSTSNINHYFYY